MILGEERVRERLDYLAELLSRVDVDRFLWELACFLDDLDNESLVREALESGANTLANLNQVRVQLRRMLEKVASMDDGQGRHQFRLNELFARLPIPKELEVKVNTWDDRMVRAAKIESLLASAPFGLLDAMEIRHICLQDITCERLFMILHSLRRLLTAEYNPNLIASGFREYLEAVSRFPLDPKHSMESLTLIMEDLEDLVLPLDVPIQVVSWDDLKRLKSFQQEKPVPLELWDDSKKTVFVSHKWIGSLPDDHYNSVFRAVKLIFEKEFKPKGFKYLWIDTLCFNPKSYSVRKMICSIPQVLQCCSSVLAICTDLNAYKLSAWCSLELTYTNTPVRVVTPRLFGLMKPRIRTEECRVALRIVQCHSKVELPLLVRALRSRYEIVFSPVEVSRWETAMRQQLSTVFW